MIRPAGTVEIETATIEPEEWVTHARQLWRDDWWFEALWGSKEPRAEVRALWGRRGRLHLAETRATDGGFPTLTASVPAADWFERALRDRTGLVPRGHVDPRPFLFHETYPEGHSHGAPLNASVARQSPDYRFIHHEGPGVFEIPVGPIHAGVIEPGHFRFTTVGEIVLDLELRLNFTHKGTLTLAQGKPIEHALRLLERLSGDNAAAHACAFAAASEAALAWDLDESVTRARTFLVELERLHNHVWDIGGVAMVTAFQAAASQFQALREDLLRWNARLFGHRLLMNVVAMGGLHAFPDPADWAAFQQELPRLLRRFEAAVNLAANHSGLKERIEGTGHLPRATAALLGCVGPTTRASGIARDARLDAPCLSYPGLSPLVVTRESGTVSSRFAVKIDEARATFDLLAGPLSQRPAPSRPDARPPSSAGEGLAMVEASRGAVLSWVRLREGRVEDVYQRDPSFLNWRALEEAAMRNIVPDFPLINKSFNLSYSGSDA